MVRPFVDETVRYGEYSKPGEFVYDHPFQWGSRRIGPDLHREGGKRNHMWHWRHFENPRSTSKGSVMPSYPHLYSWNIEYGEIQDRIDALAMLGNPYGKAALDDAPGVARAQARQIAAELAAQGGPTGVENKEAIALIAYVQRLGTDIKKATAPTAPGGN
jgi:cytochrome c oxidase cbb3-type subunit I/II